MMAKKLNRPARMHNHLDPYEYIHMDKTKTASAQLIHVCHGYKSSLQLQSSPSNYHASQTFWLFHTTRTLNECWADWKWYQTVELSGTSEPQKLEKNRSTDILSARDNIFQALFIKSSNLKFLSWILATPNKTKFQIFQQHTKSYLEQLKTSQKNKYRSSVFLIAF